MGRISLKNSNGLKAILCLNEIVAITKKNLKRVEDPLVIIDAGACVETRRENGYDIPAFMFT